LKIHSSKAVSTTIVAIIIVVLVVAAVAGIYIASQNHSTTTQTQTVTSTQTGTGSVVTTTTTASNTATSSGTIPVNTVIDGVVSPLWQGDNVGNDVQAGWSADSMWYTNNYEQLFQFDPYQMSIGNYVPIPWLATNDTLSANGTTMTINLQQNVKFHSGNTMTSADVVYSFDRFLFDHNQSSNFLNSPATGLGYADSFASMKSIKATSANQVVLTLNYPDPNLLAELSSQGFSILDAKLLEAHTVLTGTGANQTSDWGFAYLDSGVPGSDAGTGPYTVTSFTYEQRVELQTFSGYWGGPFGNFTAKVTTIIEIPYSDATTAQFALEQGQINMVQDETSAAIGSIASTPGYSVITTPTFEWMNLYMHPVGPLSNWEVRDAIKEALNYTALSTTLTNGYDKPDASFFGIGMQGYNATVADTYSSTAPNDTGALKLLAEAGYSKGFTINLYTRPDSRFGINFGDQAVLMQSELAAINITLNINIFVVGEFYDLAENTSLPGMWTVPSSLIDLSALSNIEEVLGNGNSTYLNWSAKTETGPNVPFAMMDNLYSEAQKTSSPAQALAYEAQLDTLYDQYGCTIPLLQVANTVAYSSSISGVVWNSIADNANYYYLST
jgi:ABC-type transport system substrate-binding protein